MKKTFIISLLSFLLLSCSDKANFAGTWNFQQTSINSNNRNSYIKKIIFQEDGYYSAVIAIETSSTQNMSSTIPSSSIYLESDKGRKYSTYTHHAKWIIQNNQLLLYSPDQVDTIVYDYSFERDGINNKTLILKGFIEGNYMEYKFSKEQ